MRARARARRIGGLLAAATAAVGIAVAGAEAAPPPISGTHPWIVALCKFTDLNTEPSTYTPSYFSQMFSGAGYAGTLDFQHWWSEISYGNLSVAGTKVTTKWYSLGMTRFEWAGLNRYDKIRTCGDAAALDPNIGNDYSKYYGIVAIFNDDVVPGSGTPARTASTTLTGGNLNMSNTTITVASSAGFPAPPFAVTIDDGSQPNGGNAEELHVIGVVGTTWTLSTRGYEGTTPKNHNNGAAISLIDGGDLGNSGGTAIVVTLNGKPYTLGMVVLPPETNMGATQHETGHGFGYAHSRALSTPTSDYNDCYDIMSFDSCDYNFQGDFGSAGVLGDSLPAAVGPGLDAINLDIQGWMPGGRTFSFSPGSCSQTTRDLAALNHPEASGDMEVRVPAAVTIPLPTPPGGTTSTDYYTIELRDKSLWDRAIPQNSVLLHLHGLNGVSYWVDVFNGSTVGHGGALYLADEFVDTGNNVVVAVNRMNTSAHTATIAMATGGAGCKINASAAYSGATTADFNDPVTLAADLTVAGTSVPVPNANVTLSLGTQSCPATTDANGHASCSFTITQHPGTYTASVSYAGDAAYNATTSAATNNFTITKEESQVTYTGVTSADYHDSFTASATLVDPVGGAPIANKPIVFTLNGVDTCTDTTNSAGFASCPINPTQAAGSYTLVAAFGGDVDYLSSSTPTPFTVTREETTTTYTGPTVILAGSGAATLTARLQEDGANDDDSDAGNTGPPSPSGQPVTLSIGSQSCTGFADPSGDVQCMINPVIVPLGPEPLNAEFLGDAFYLPSADAGKTAIVFAFPSRGAFVLGDLTTLAVPPLVTWWSHSWPFLNDLTGGGAPASFKGFADDISTLPTKSPANVCGTTFTTQPGNSPAPVPASSIPSYMGVLVASAVTKRGSRIDGTWSSIVVVETNAGYEANPGHPGTGSIVATFCP